MTIIAHHRGRVYSDRQLTCDYCNKVVDTDNDEWDREKGTIWHVRCSNLEMVKEDDTEAFTCSLCGNVVGYTWTDAPDPVYCIECKEKYK